MIHLTSFLGTWGMPWGKNIFFAETNSYAPICKSDFFHTVQKDAVENELLPKSFTSLLTNHPSHEALEW